MNHNSLSRFAALLSKVSVAILTPLLLCFALTAAVKPELPNFDKRVAQASPLSAAKKADGDTITAKVRGAKINTDPIVGTPTMVASTSEFLTEKNGRGKSVSNATADSIPDTDSHKPAKTFLKEHSAVFGFGPEALDAATVKKDYTTKVGNFRTVIWQQHIDDIPVFEAIFKAHWTANGELINVGTKFVPNLTKASNKIPNRKAFQAAPPISAKQAIVFAAQNIGDAISTDQISDVDQASGNEKKQHFRGGKVLNDVQTRLTWLPLDDSTVQLCWQVTLVSRARGEGFDCLVDAQTGEILVRHCLTAYLSSAQYNVFLGDSPSPLAPGYTSPNTNQPSLVSRSLVNVSAINSTASPNGWINDGDNTTVGNNVDAHLDVNNDDVPDANSRPVGSPFRVFDFPLDLTTQQPWNYTNAAVVNLFFWNNWMHDTLYGYGFDEASGNFQTDNFGRGGKDNDAVQADAQDASSADSYGFPQLNPTNRIQYDNANFLTLEDGLPGRMQMYIWYCGPSQKWRDGDLDQHIICHEYTHGLSTRLVGGGVGISLLEAQGMGEGWSDFVALSLLSKQTDDVNANYPFAPYVDYFVTSNGVVSANYYYGIRRYPYSYNMSVNPLTFKDIDPAQLSLHGGVPKNPSFAGTAEKPAEPHEIGEVWCQMLWDCRALMINRYGYSGNQMMLQLVVTGMKLSSVNPTFTDSRNAILEADLVLNSGANHDILWSAFARRGLGINASAPGPNTTSGVVEDYSLPGSYMTVAITSPTEEQILASSPTVSGITMVSQGYVQLELQRISDGAYYNFKSGGWDATFNGNSDYVAVTNFPNWSYSLPSLPEGRYVVSAAAVTQTATSQFFFRFFRIDPVLPTVSFDPLTNGSVVFDLSQVRGSVNKPQTVEYRIAEPGTNGITGYWNGSSFIVTNSDSSAVWNAASVSGTSWTPTTALPTRAQTKSYQVYYLDVRGTDGENVRVTNQVLVLRSMEDTTPPGVTIDSIATNQIITNNYLPGVFGTATDPDTGIGNIDIYLMWFTSGNYLYWTGAGWSPNPTALHPTFPTGGGTYNLGSLPSGSNLQNGTYQLQVYAQNQESPPATHGVSVTFTVDYHPVYVWTEGSYTDNISGNENHNWDNWANWDQESVPTSDAIIVINGGTCDATMMGSLNIYRVDIGGGTFKVNGLITKKLNVSAGLLAGGAVNVDTNGIFNWSGGQLNGIYGLLAGSTNNMFGTTKELGGGGTVLNNSGTINWTNGVFHNYAYYDSDHATFNNLSNGTFNVYGDGSLFSQEYYKSVFNNLPGSHFVKAGGTGTNTIGNYIFNNSGELRAGSGTIEIGTATLDLLSGGVESGTILCDGNSTINSQGATTISNGVLTVQNSTLHGDPNSSIATTNGNLEIGAASLDGVVEIAPNGQVVFSGPGTKTFNASAVLRNYGDIFWTGGDVYNYAYYDGTQGIILNFSGAGFYALCDNQITSDYHPAYFTNYPGATFMKASGTATNQINWAMNNNGLVVSRVGVINLNGGGTGNGEFSANAGAFVRFTGGVHKLNDGALFSGAGHIQIDGNVEVTRNGTINGGATSPTTFDFVSGTFDGTGSLAQKLALNWTGGSVGGLLNIGSAVTVNMTGSNAKSMGDAAQINNYGTVNWSGTGALHNYGYYGGTQAIFVNQTNAVFNLLTDGNPFWQEYNRSYFTNLGLFAKTGGTGTNSLAGYNVENLGEIRANIGTLQFSDFLDLDTGSLVSGPATVRFSGNVNMNAPVSNTGNIILDAGTLTGATSTNGTALSSYSGTGTFNWMGGAMAGRFVLEAGNTIGINGDNNKTLASGAFFDNYGAVNWSGPGAIYNYAYFQGQQATFNNYSNAAFNLLTDGNIFIHDNNESYFTNFAGGIVAKIAGGATNTFNSFLFENYGEIQAQIGHITFNDYLDLFHGSKLSGPGQIHFTGNTALYGTMQGNAETVALDAGTFNAVAGSNATYSGTSPLTWNAGTINGYLTIQSGSTMNVAGTADKTLGAGATLNNAGTVNWSGPGRIYNYAYSWGQQATINNMPSANFNLLTDGEVFIHDYNASWFTNQPGAHFTKLLGAGTNNIHAFNMYDFGEVRAQSGFLQFTENLDINQGATFTGVGLSQLVNGTATLHGQMDVMGPTFQVLSGTFIGDTSGNPSIATENGGAFEWVGGSLQGTLRVLSGASMKITGDNLKNLNIGTILNNAGTITWSGNGSLYNNAYYDGQQAIINNLSGGLFDIVGGGSLTHDYNASKFYNNAGATFRKTAGSDSSCNWIFSNDGTIDLRTGNFINTGLTLGSNGIVNLALTATNSNAQLTQNNPLSMAGALNVLPGNVVLTNGLSFTLATYSSQTGTFSPFSLPALPSRYKWSVNYGPTTLTAAVVAATVLNAPVKNGNGGLDLNLTGAAASAAILQTSIDLNTWTSVYTNAPFTGTFDFNDTPAPGETKKFYRILIVP